MFDLAIIPECYVDTNLIETIAPTNVGYNHQKGCGTVTKLMQTKFKDKFAVGIIDKDKNELKYANEFDLIIDVQYLQLYSHKEIHTHHYLIFIIPAIEKWVLLNANEVDILLSSFELPNDFNELKKITKRIDSKYDNRFKKLFNNLKSNKAKYVLILGEWITYLKNNNYNVNINELKQVTNNLLNEEI